MSLRQAIFPRSSVSLWQQGRTQHMYCEGKNIAYSNYLGNSKGYINSLINPQIIGKIPNSTELVPRFSLSQKFPSKERAGSKLTNKQTETLNIELLKRISKESIQKFYKEKLKMRRRWQVKNTNQNTISMDQINVVNRYFAISLNKCDCLYRMRYKIYIKTHERTQEKSKRKKLSQKIWQN